MAPVATVPELLSSDQLGARGYWEEVDGIRYPGPFAIAGGGGPRMAPLGPSPELGQHTAEVLDAVPVGAAAAGSAADGRSESTSNRREASTSERTPAAPLPAPLAGIKVADLTWYMAGPATTRMMADWGATVVRVESVSRPDGGRGSGPFPRGKSDPDAGGYGLTPQLRQAGPGARPVEGGLAAGARGPGALGRRGRRQLQPAGHPQPAPRLGITVGDQPPADPGEHLPDGPIGSAGRVRRVREPLRRRGRLLRGRRLARPPAGGPLPRLHRRGRAPLHVLLHPRRAGRAAAHRSRAATSTSPRPRRRCGCSPPTSSTTS